MEEPRAYQNEADLKAMIDLLIAGRHARNGSYYVHTGDLCWWLFYPPLSGGLWSSIYLWGDPDESEHLLAWTLLSGGDIFEVYVQPELRGSTFARQAYTWAIEQCAQRAQQNGLEKIRVMWIAEDDDLLPNWLQEAGFVLKKNDVLMERYLEVGDSGLAELQGFCIRACHGEKEVEARAKAQYSTFGNTAPFEQYLERWRKFMRSPVYDPELETLAVAPDGCIAAFCLTWTDPVNRIGLFEPVGTHPDFRRLGLGRAVMAEACRRLAQRGMTRAMVCTSQDNLPAIKLYESVGFRTVNRLGMYQKQLIQM